jgi:hypothetical protein
MTERDLSNFMVGEIPGWRAWEVVGEHTMTPRLQSPAGAANDNMAWNGIWPTDRWAVAECPHGHSVADVPAENCGCGMYAANTLEWLLGRSYGALAAGVEQCKAIGEVALAGRVIRGDDASRAQKARVVRLFVPFSKPLLGQALGRAYNVPWEFGPWWATDPRLGGRS